ncbi:hypothetical protein HOG98_07465 [bacterium]|jgi:hypothetical protein|nr:hypothetical protein [bacterium]
MKKIISNSNHLNTFGANVSSIDPLDDINMLFRGFGLHPRSDTFGLLFDIKALKLELKQLGLNPVLELVKEFGITPHFERIMMEKGFSIKDVVSNLPLFRHQSESPILPKLYLGNRASVALYNYSLNDESLREETGFTDGYFYFPINMQYSGVLSTGGIIFGSEGSMYGTNLDIKSKADILDIYGNLFVSGVCFVLFKDGRVESFGEGLDTNSVNNFLDGKSVSHIEVANEFSYVLLENGQLWSLKNQNFLSNSSPVMVAEFVDSVCQSKDEMVLIYKDGTIGQFENGSVSMLFPDLGRVVSVCNASWVSGPVGSRRENVVFAAIFEGGELRSWGKNLGDWVLPCLDGGGIQLRSTDRSFCCVLEDGGVITWGDQSYGGVCPNIWGLDKVIALFSTGSAFFVVLESGHCAIWGVDVGEDVIELDSGVRVTSVQSTPLDFYITLNGSSIYVIDTESNAAAKELFTGDTILSCFE